MRPTEELKQEHRVIERMLKVLFAISQKLQKGEDVDPRLIRKSVDFVRNFADKCHHGKEEDLLFPAIEQRGFPREGGPVGMMLIEHDEGRGHVRELAAALEKYEAGDASATVNNAMAAHALGYARLLALHIEKEDGILYDIADRVIPPAEQERLLRQFVEAEENTIGHAKHQEYIDSVADLEKAVGS